MSIESPPFPSSFSQLVSFDGTEKAEVWYTKPDRYHSLFSTLKTAEHFSIQGAGLSLPLASAAEGGITVSSEAFNRILSFDPENLEITVEPNLRVGDLLKFLLRRGYWFSPLPGHPNISIGGCIGFNIHGKSKGYFSQSIKSFMLYQPDHGELEVRQDNEHAFLFGLTLGGAGSTGFVTQVTLQIQELEGESLKKKKLPLANLWEAPEQLETLKTLHAQVYSWNDLTQKDRLSFGKGTLYCEDFSSAVTSTNSNDFTRLTAKNRGHVRPGSLLAPMMGRKINRAYSIKESLKETVETLDAFSGAFPISGNEIYFHLFGAKGYRESQLLIPLDNWKAFCDDLYLITQKALPDITLGSLKLFNETYDNYLNFTHKGVVLAINAVANPKTLSYFSELDKLVIRHQGLPNVYKDSRLSSDVIEQTYGERLHRFKRDLLQFDKRRRVQSAFLQRILK
ncbi:MAG: FAD-binding oxidoreductase [Bdellovibrionales bacterium]|nr:FAD-binding oxidoreductase [Bdellovibrionales bacterium]